MHMKRKGVQTDKLLGDSEYSVLALMLRCLLLVKLHHDAIEDLTLDYVNEKECVK